MNVFISIDGVLRNFINRFHYHYEQAYIDVDSDDDFKYEVSENILNDDLSKYFKFQSIDEKNHFQYFEYPMELYGHSPVSYNNVNNDLNYLIYNNPKINFFIVGMDEFFKAKAATFFFLSRNGFIVNNVKFITKNDIEKNWKKTSVWISDSGEILSKKPDKKRFILFETPYNLHLEHNEKINKLSELKIKGKNICIQREII